jgi:hypothetical protein
LSPAFCCPLSVFRFLAGHYLHGLCIAAQAPTTVEAIESASYEGAGIAPSRAKAAKGIGIPRSGAGESPVESVSPALSTPARWNLRIFIAGG